MPSFQKLLAVLLCSLCVNSSSFCLGGYKKTRRPHCASLQLGASNHKGRTSNAKPKGVYVRPSAVIEKGSGFFFPGLEGPRVRLVVGSGLLLVTVFNHFLSTSTSAFSEGLSVFYSFLVLLQGAIEITKEGRIQSISVPISGKNNNSFGDNREADLFQQWSAVEDERNTIDKRIEWAATSYLFLTAATHMILIKNSTICYWLGITPHKNPPTAARVCSAALTTVQQSKGGRVALPEDHPAVKGIVQDQAYCRCVILQRIDPGMCWMVTSNELLASFTKQDLQWLGRFATYVGDILENDGDAS